MQRGGATRLLVVDEKRRVVLVGQRKVLAIDQGRPVKAVVEAPGLADVLMQRGGSLTEIYVDRDACSVREEVYRVAARLQLKRNRSAFLGALDAAVQAALREAAHC